MPDRAGGQAELRPELRRPAPAGLEATMADGGFVEADRLEPDVRGGRDVVRFGEGSSLAGGASGAFSAVVGLGERIMRPMDDDEGRSSEWTPLTVNASGDPFEAAITAALEGIPEPYRSQLSSVAIVVQDEPDADQLASVGARGLLGLYEGVPRTAYGADHAPVASKITLFRGPLLRAYRRPEDLVRGVRATLEHELAHHLGISDARLRELDVPRA